jgi:F0F1-type ATP synthase beta subunit
MSVKIPPRGVEPLKGNRQALDNKTLTKNEKPVFATSLAILLQKYPELQEIISTWPNLTQAAKGAVLELVKSKSGGLEYAVNDQFEKR